MKKYLKVFWRHFVLRLSQEMAYKLNFILKCGALAFMDVISPIIALIIYQTTSGIPGWAFEEFLLFQGTAIFVFGFSSAFFMWMTATAVDAVRDGTFDITLLKPFSPLLYVTFGSVNLNGFAEMFVGVAVIILALLKLNITFVSFNTLAYLFLVFLALVFQYAIMILISSFAFLFIKSYSLYDIYSTVTNFARYPLSVYNSELHFFLTFIFPVAISSHYPAEALLHGMSILGIVKVGLPVIIFFIIALIFWKVAMKKYGSAGG